jgi:hypothetical protein
MTQAAILALIAFAAKVNSFHPAALAAGSPSPANRQR